MEIRDGFIVGIFNYCDRWCETCAFTSRCRLFADVAELDAKLDPNLKDVADAPPLPEDVPPPPPQWMQDMIQEMNEAADDPTIAVDPPPPPPPEHLLIEARADDYFTRAHGWLRARSIAMNDPADPVAVINWFHLQIVVKVHRAIRGLAEDGPDFRDWPPDHDGSAKVALLRIDRSHAAWLIAIERGVVTRAEAEPFVSDLVWLGDSLERVFPHGDLCDDQYVAPPQTPRRIAPSAACLERGSEIGARAVNGGHESKEPSGNDAGSGRERQHSPVEECFPVEAEIEVEPQAIGQWQINREQRVDQHNREDETCHGAAKTEQRALDEQLTRERPSRRTEGAAHGHFLPSIERARHEKAREVRAREQEHQAHNRHAAG